MISNVSDTALWVAYYRAEESKRTDALFKDRLARLLVGELGEKIALDMKKLGRYSEYNVVMRTVIIDQFIMEAIKEGIDTVINLGAGMDTRPYRMELPDGLRWVEVDQPGIIDLKNELLKGEVPQVELFRVALDLSNDLMRKEFLQKWAAQSEKILVITEGVIPYLSEQHVSDLAEDLLRFQSIEYWLAEYIHPRIYPYLKSRGRARKMRNAPFQFFPDDWMGFFKQNGWTPKDIRYYAIEGEKRGRTMPSPWWTFLFRFLAPEKAIEESKRAAGFMCLKKTS